MTEAITRIIPIILLMIIGIMIQVKNLADNDTMDKLKKGIITLALPALLFMAFMNMELRAEYLVMSAIFIATLYLFYFIGTLINKIKAISHPILPFLMTGFAFGLLGIPLFGGVYGYENLDGLSILGIGHEFFAWFIYFTMVKHKLGAEKFSGKTVINFIKSPLIIAIVLGVVVNLTGIKVLFEEVILLKGIALTLESIGSITTPLMLVIIGYGIRFEKAYMAKSFQLLLIRLVVVLVVGYSVKFLFLDQYTTHLNGYFDMSFYTFMILPPPFTLAIFVSEYSTKENAAVANNTIVLSTLFCVVAFAIGVIVNGA